MRSFLSFIVMVLLPLGVASAQSQVELDQNLKTALAANDSDDALKAAEQLYELSHTNGDFETAGRAAFAQAQIYESQAKHSEAAKSYEKCEDGYRAVNAFAQTLQCKYQAGKAQLSSGQKGTGIKTLKKTVKELEDINQGHSGIAANAYLALSKEVLPSKKEERASGERKQAAQYADKAMAALRAQGQDKSELYAAALFNKGMALEDDKQFEGAYDAYKVALDLFEVLPNTSEDVLSSVRTRLQIAKFGKDPKKDDKTMTVHDASGAKITLEVDKKKRVKSPRVNSNQIVDGATAEVEITLNADGSVKTIKVTESSPVPDYGEALKKGVESWRFTPPDGVAAQNIPPFSYGMTFYVTRR